LVLLVWGEGYHSIHHADPTKNRFGKFDLGGIIIDLLD
jgi:fatty-acid desaturase